jgi:predicted GIY-YIG superfamily endonuclease
MKKQTDYTKGLIYKIYCNDENITDIYIGSTVDFKRRKGTHKSSCHNEKDKEYTNYKYKFIRDNGGWSNWTMIELYKYPCANKRELEQEEDRMMIELKSTLNKYRAFRTEEEIKAYNKKYKIEYHANNRETLNKKSAEHRAKNTETLNKKSAEHRAKIRETINKKNAEYRAKNRETINKKNAEYRAKNRETLNMKQRDKIKCINCGCFVSRNNISTHMKSNKCISHNKE